MIDSDSEFVRHEPCSACGSSDALARYSDNHAHCFSCGHYEHGDGSVSFHKPQRTMDFTGDIIPLKGRAILEDTCKKFNVRYDAYTKTLRFPYYNSGGQLVAFKARNADKEFSWSGKNEDHQLFGQQLFGGAKGNNKTLVITEGELDAMSVWQARPNWPVVSLDNGAKAAKRSLQHQYKFVDRYDEIVLLFDSDDAGQLAAQECAQLFNHAKVFIARLSEYKDANEAIVAKDAEAIRQAFWQKKPYSPKTVVDASDLFDLVRKPLHGKDADWPYVGLNNMVGGLRLSELVTLTAGSGVGKSTVCGEVAQSLVDQGFKVLYIAMEEGLQRTALRLMSIKANRPLHLNNELPDEDFKQAFDQSIGTGQVFLRDGFGSVDPDAILSDCRFAVQAKGVRWIILDHLSILMSGNDSHDERKLIDVTMTKLRSFVEETSVGMILISHLRRPQGDKGHEDGLAVSLGQLRGSHSIVQLSDLVLSLERSVSSGQTATVVRCLKNRFNGKCGKATVVSYQENTGRMVEDLTAEFNTPADDTDDRGLPF